MLLSITARLTAGIVSLAFTSEKGDGPCKLLSQSAGKNPKVGKKEIMGLLFPKQREVLPLRM